MKLKKLVLPLAAMMAFAVGCSSTPPPSGGGEDDDLTVYESLSEIRLSSFYAKGEAGGCKLKMKAPYDDSYHFEFLSRSSVKSIRLLDTEGNELISSDKAFDITLKKDQIVYADIEADEGNIKIDVKAKDHARMLPFEPLAAPDPSSFKTDSTLGDPAKVQADNKTHVGYYPKKEGDRYTVGACYVGNDEGMVVDSSAVWEFNDNTPAQSLPVRFTVSYAEVDVNGEPYSKIESTPKTFTENMWMSHCCPFAPGVIKDDQVLYPVGTDMTDFHTVDPEGNPIISGNDYYDGRGRIANIGNWMKDYFETYTFVNRGNTDREIQIILIPVNGGCITTTVWDADGNPIEGSERFNFYRGKTEFGDAVNEPFSYTVTVKAHSVWQGSVEYNLLANSNGSITHEIKLK